MSDKRTIDFSKSPILQDYYSAVKDNFTLFRILLPDEVDAILTHFIENKSMTTREMQKLDDGFKSAIQKLALQYPNKVPKSASDVLNVPDQVSYNSEEYNFSVVFNLMQILVHLSSATSAILNIK